jgi:hypothetical protein
MQFVYVEPCRTDLRSLSPPVFQCTSQKIIKKIDHVTKTIPLNSLTEKPEKLFEWDRGMGSGVNGEWSEWSKWGEWGERRE